MSARRLGWAVVRDDPRLEALTIQVDAFGTATCKTWVRAEMDDWHWRRILSIAETTPAEESADPGRGVSRVVSVVIDGQTIAVTSPSARRLVVRSGGQSGVDRAALDAAIACDLPYTGYVPKGGLCEDRPWIDLLATYPSLVEMTTESYPARTVANVKAADATLIIARQFLGKGTALTIRAAEKARKPHLVLRRQSISTVLDWLADIDADPLELNIAGPRESGAPGIYDKSLAFLTRLFEHITKEY